jgi:hypothetical protein
VIKFPKHIYSAKSGAASKIKVWGFVQQISGTIAEYKNQYRETIHTDVARLLWNALKLTKNEVIDELQAKLQKRIDYLEKQRD